MTNLSRLSTLAALAATLTVLSACSTPMPSGSNTNPMTFFLTSANPGKGGDLGGLAGADAYCKTLATNAGAGNHTWHAYLSATVENSAGKGAGAVNARDRIGSGPWTNAKGAVIAKNVSDLHGETNNLSKETALTEKGDITSGRGDAQNNHDVLTGSMPDGSAADGTKDSTCGNWTKSGEGSAIVGHHDRMGLNESAPMKSWNSSHPTRGCSLEALRSTGGGGLFYCFAVN